MISGSMKKKQLGQGMTEYIIIVALIAVAAIGAYSYFGEAVQHQVASLAQEISGENVKAAESTVKASEAADDSDDSAGIKSNMNTFHDSSKVEAGNR